MFAIIETGGKQYRVEPGMELAVGKIEGTVGGKITLSQIVALGEDGKLETGQPYLSGAVVEAELVAQERGAKILIIKKKRRQGYRRRLGARAELSRIKIAAIKRGAN